ncbi:MAG: DUF4124 domain-containing protein [Granulosicoccus sp.]
MTESALVSLRRSSLLWGIGIFLSLFWFSQPVKATIYKCVDASGNTTYTGSPCPADESTKKISSTAAQISGQDCRIARNFSQAVAAQLKQGTSSNEVFDYYGGLGSLSPTSIGLISYIYTFSGNASASASRIAHLATDRCKIGSFGESASRCESFPYEFIDSMGGCELASGAGGSNIPGLGAAQAVQTADTEPHNRYQAAEHSAASAQSPERSREYQRESCRQRISETIAQNEQSMRAPQAVATMESLRTRGRQLRSQLSKC